jgi:hypothetical protein
MSLFAIVPSKFQPLLPLETLLIQNVEAGEDVRPVNNSDKEIRANLFNWLCTDSEAVKLIGPKGIVIIDSDISDDINLAFHSIKFPIRLIRCYIRRPIKMMSSSIPILDMTGCDTHGLQAQRIKVSASLYLCKENIKDGKEFYSDGEINLFGATIDGDFNCDGGFFNNADGYTILAEHLHVKGSVLLRNGFISTGELNFLEAVVEKQLNCEGGGFNNKGKTAFLGDGMSVGASMMLRKDPDTKKNFVSLGLIKLYGAQLNELDCNQAILSEENGTCFDATDMDVKGTFRWLPIKPIGKVVLRNATVRVLEDKSVSWPEQKGSLDLDGFKYESFQFNELANAKARLNWLSLQFPPRNFRSAFQRTTKKIYNLFTRDPEKKKRIYYPYSPGIQPYEQLINVLRSMGLNDEVRAVQIAKNKYITHRAKWYTKPVRWTLSGLVSYGFNPGKVLIPILIIIFLGYTIFSNAAQAGLMAPTGNPVEVNGIKTYPVFNPFLYSVDVFLPIVDLHQESYWIPNTPQPGGESVMRYMVFHIMAGWFLTTLGVAAVTGLVKTG